ncbi:MAG: helix-turn-helix domain-containing protein [Tannerellaceae bacterium]|nr:helix-turn-helix domain-containing protein [Tannerellaceae bacterium]
MERIFSRLDAIEKKLNIIVPKQSALEGEELLDNQDLMIMLKCSLRTLQTYRDKKYLPFVKTEGKCYYRAEDVKEFIHRKMNQ